MYLPTRRLTNGRIATTVTARIVSMIFAVPILLLPDTIPAHELHTDHGATEDFHVPTRTVSSPEDIETRRLIRAFRQTGDDRYLDEANERLERLLSSGRREPDILISAATVAQSRHEFDSAQELIGETLKMGRGNDQAWLLLASVQLVRGNVDAAQNACRELRHVHMLIVFTCHARISIARGSREAALQRLTAVLASVDKSTVEPESMAWSLSVAADAAATIDQELSTDLYRQSLDIAESTQVRAALVDVLLTEGRLGEAETALAAGADALPLAIRRMIVARRMGRVDTVREDIARAHHKFTHWIEDDDWAHAREMTRFYLDVLERPLLARRLALVNASLQREPEDLLLARRTEEL